jgi:hypothetical protein
VRVSFGPKGESWYATDGRAWKWHNLPSELQKVIDANFRDGSFTTPRIVSLGVGGDFVWVTQGDGASWSTKSYKMVEDAFRQLKETVEGDS